MIYQLTPITNPAITGITGKTGADAAALFGKLISGVIGIFLTGASLWAFFQLLQGGLQWISSGGDKSALETAQHRITNALIGLFIVFSSWAIYIIILQYLGIIGGGPGIQFRLPTLF